MRTLATITASHALVNKGFLSAVEQTLLAEKQADCPVYHSFGPGIYMRELHMKRGTLAIGHTQKYEHQNILLKGAVRMLNEDGTTTDIRAPTKFVGKPGRKVGYVLEDVVWLNIFSTPETDVAVLEETLFEKSDYFIEQQRLRVDIARIERLVDRDDFKDVLREFGVSITQLNAEVELPYVNLPFGGYPVKLGDSSIEGRGLFATALIHSGDVICPATIGGLRTIAGRFTNHAMLPNCTFQKNPAGDIYLVALRDIKGCHGGYDGEELTVNYREALKLMNRKELKCQVLSQQLR